MGSGGTMLTDHVHLVYVTSSSDRRILLKVAVLVRTAESFWQRDEKTLSSLPSMPPVGAGRGSGGTAGGHGFFLERDSQLLWIDGEPTLRIKKDNVVLTDESENLDQIPAVVGTCHVAEDLGPAPTTIDPGRTFRTSLAVISTLSERLRGHPVIKEFLVT